MKESYVKGPANHNGPESCGGARKGEAEALTGECAGRVLSREMNLVRDADPV
jgi:RNA-directed DNA polymerase